MIDFTNQIFTLIYQAVIEVEPDAAVTGEPILEEVRFPNVEVLFIDNQTYRQSRTLLREERHSLNNIQIRITTKGANKRRQNKNIQKAIAEALEPRGFLRTGLPIVMNDDVTIYEQVMRYRGIISPEGVVF